MSNLNISNLNISNLNISNLGTTGDVVEVGFSGNIECGQDVDGTSDRRRASGPEELIFKSNVPTMTYFTVKEENRFRQKDHDVFSGLLVLTRKYIDPVKKTTAMIKRLQSQSHIQVHSQGHEGDDLSNNQSDHAVPEREWKRERLCALQINI
ncbi:hypothetical protein EGW08_009410, partial [Elysia chlorotica]